MARDVPLTDEIVLGGVQIRIWNEHAVTIKDLTDQFVPYSLGDFAIVKLLKRIRELEQRDKELREFLALMQKRVLEDYHASSTVNLHTLPPHIELKAANETVKTVLDFIGLQDARAACLEPELKK